MDNKWARISNDGIHIENSYSIWNYNKMKMILQMCSSNPRLDFNRSYFGMIIEWYLHNLGYYLLLPFAFLIP